MISDEELEQWFNDANNGQRRPKESDRGRIFRLLSAYRELKAENEELRQRNEAINEEGFGVIVELQAERDRLINLSVALESELAAFYAPSWVPKYN